MSSNPHDSLEDKLTHATHTASMLYGMHPLARPQSQHTHFLGMGFAGSFPCAMVPEMVVTSTLPRVMTGTLTPSGP